MYARDIDQGVHTFGVSGKLIMNALVMYDHQTRTLWSQFLGQGVKGPLAGKKLELIPVIHTTWSLWKESHPDTLVLNKRGRYQRDAYLPYYYGNSAGVLGEARRDTRLERKAIVVGVAFDGHTKAYSLDRLLEDPVVNDSLGERDIIVFVERETETALVYDRSVDGRSLTFRLGDSDSGYQSTLVDQETGTTWMAVTGVATDGELKGKRLERAPSHLSYWFAWKDWNPETEVYEASAESVSES